MSPSSQLEPWVNAESHHETFMILTEFDLLEFLPFQLEIFYFTVHFVVAEKTFYLPSMVFCLLVALGCDEIFCNNGVWWHLAVESWLQSRNVVNGWPWPNEHRPLEANEHRPLEAAPFIDQLVEYHMFHQMGRLSLETSSSTICGIMMQGKAHSKKSLSSGPSPFMCS